MRLLEPLGIKMNPPQLRTSIGESEEPKWEDWLKSHQAKRPRIGIWPGSRKLERRYYAAGGRADHRIDFLSAQLLPLTPGDRLGVRRMLEHKRALQVLR